MPKKASIDDMVAAVLEAEKPLTETEIAERADVARRTVGNRRDELQSRDEIRYGKVGGATAYWSWNIVLNDLSSQDRSLTYEERQEVIESQVSLSDDDPAFQAIDAMFAGDDLPEGKTMQDLLQAHEQKRYREEAKEIQSSQNLEDLREAVITLLRFVVRTGGISGGKKP